MFTHGYSTGKSSIALSRQLLSPVYLSLFLVARRLFARMAYRKQDLRSARLEKLAEVHREAVRLVGIFGASAYEEARKRKREANDPESIRFWSWVKSEIGQRTVLEDGLAEINAICGPIVGGFDELLLGKYIVPRSEQVKADELGRILRLCKGCDLWSEGNTGFRYTRTAGLEIDCQADRPMRRGCNDNTKSSAARRVKYNGTSQSAPA